MVDELELTPTFDKEPKKAVQWNHSRRMYGKEPWFQKGKASCTGLETTVRILVMVVFQSGKGIVFDGLGHAENAHPETNSMVRVGQQGDHSSVGNVVGLISKFYQIILLYQIS